MKVLSSFSRYSFLLLALAMLFPQQLPAQGLFEAFGIPKTVTATGHTEILGTVQVSVRLGAVLADTLVIDVSPLQITNAAASDIRVTANGNITAGVTTIDAPNGQVRVPVNAGGSNGNLRVDGIRVSVSGASLNSVTARLSWANRQNILSAAQSVVVVNQVQSGLGVDPMTDGFLIYNNTVLDNTATIVVREGYAASFTTSNDFGQNTPTRLRIRVSDFPSGLKMTFPATVTANESGATLGTVEGTAVDIPRSDGTTEITYNFNGAANSSAVLESFNIPFTVSTSGPVARLQPTIEVSLAPVGAIVPTAALPATNIPRFAEENLVALEGSSRIVTRTLYMTGIDSSRQNRLSIFNPSSNTARITLSSFDASGQLVRGANVDNPVLQLLPATQSSNLSLTDVFGVSATNIAAIRIQSTEDSVVALGTTTFPSGVSEFVPVTDRTVSIFALPGFGEPGLVSLFNPGSTPVSGTLTSITSAGAFVLTKNFTVAPLASVSASLADLFGTPGPGQIVGNFPPGLIAYESFGNPGTLDFVTAQISAGVPSLYVPFAATGNGYETDLSLVNSGTQSVTLNAQLLNISGTVVASKQFGLAAGAQLLSAVSTLFNVQGATSGYIRVDVPPAVHGPWISYPLISGYTRIRSTAGSAAYVISGYPQQESSILASGPANSEFQGIALVNPNSSAVTVTLKALSSTGAVLAGTSVDLAPGQISAKLTSELFSTAIPQGSVIRVTSTAPIVSTSITGSLNGDALRATPGLR